MFVCSGTIITVNNHLRWGYPEEVQGIFIVKQLGTKSLNIIQTLQAK